MALAPWTPKRAKMMTRSHTNERQAFRTGVERVEATREPSLDGS
jgi:hypothetical protein